MRRYATHRRGASAVEYGLLVGLIAAGAIVAVQQSGDRISGLMSAAANQIDAVPAVSTTDAGPMAGSTCKTLFDTGQTTSGVYRIDPDGDGNGFDAYCEMSAAGGGWTFVGTRGGTNVSAPTVLDPSSVGVVLDDARWTETRDASSEMLVSESLVPKARFDLAAAMAANCDGLGGNLTEEVLFHEEVVNCSGGSRDYTVFGFPDNEVYLSAEDRHVGGLVLEVWSGVWSHYDAGYSHYADTGGRREVYVR